MDRLISEKEVLKAVSKGCCEWRGVYARCEEGIKAIPSAEPKTGHRIYWHTNGFGRKIYKCSKCNWNGDMAGYNFCPNCGCRIVDEQERSDKG